MKNVKNKVYRKKALGFGLVLALFCIIGEPAHSEELPDYSLGARTGIMVSGSMETSFNLYEAVGSFRLPWSYAWESGWLFATEVDITAGNLRAAQDNGFIASAGPGFTLAIPQRWMSFVLGLRVVYLNDYQFGGEDLGGNLSFLQELGVEFKVYSGLHAGYRFQHMSNAGIYDNNPGIEMHILELRYRF